MKYTFGSTVDASCIWEAQEEKEFAESYGTLSVISPQRLIQYSVHAVHDSMTIKQKHIYLFNSILWFAIFYDHLIPKDKYQSKFFSRLERC